MGGAAAPHDAAWYPCLDPRSVLQALAGRGPTLSQHLAHGTRVLRVVPAPAQSTLHAPPRRDPTHPGRGWGRLSRGELGHRDACEHVPGILGEPVRASPRREADSSVLFGCHRNPEKQMILSTCLPTARESDPAIFSGIFYPNLPLNIKAASAREARSLAFFLPSVPPSGLSTEITQQKLL